ncbi:MAG: RluA family pseudouridine synthase [Pseudomonadales bacterium]|nr:RluA family pseudouridine synthase [Pseudomonadales bacterium]
MQVTFYDEVSHRSAGQVLHGYISMSFRFVTLDWISHIQCGGVTVDGSRADPFQLIEGGQSLAITIPDYHEKPVDTHWHLLWQNEELFAVHKPAGLPVHRTPRHIVNTLITLVKRESEWPDAHLLHRLDSDTGGILLLGKNKAAAVKWQSKIQKLMIQKVYHAVVYGKPDWLEYDMQCELSAREDAAIRAQVFVCEAGESGKFSHSHFRYLSGNDQYSMIECEIFTGRKHQIRAQLAHLGHAIVGDKIYANNGEYYLKRLTKTLTPEDEIKRQTSHHLLFAQRVCLVLTAEQDKTVEINNAHYPDQWRAFCQKQGFVV